MYKGRGISFVCKHLRRFLQSVRYATVCHLQSDGEAQNGTAGYHTDTRHTRAELGGTSLSAGGRGKIGTTMELSSQMQKQLNTCIHHHQDMKRYVENPLWAVSAAASSALLQRLLCCHGKITSLVKRYRSTEIFKIR
jgi:hypothetical protein